MERVAATSGPTSSEVACGVCSQPVEGARCTGCGAAHTAGAFRITRVIAVTPHSRLYGAVGPGGQTVALKELLFATVPTIEQVEAFEREAKLLQQLDHPAIPRFVASFSEGTGLGLRLYLAQQLVPSDSLQSRVGHRPFTAAEAIQCAEALLEVLRYLHQRTPPLLHRDLKPANVIQRPDGTLALVDFGSARILSSTVTHGATLVGTFGYMAPEQLGGTVSTRSDLYALGATLVTLLTGKPPWERMNDQLALELKGPQVPDPLRKFLSRLLAVRPADRFSSAGAALAFLRRPWYRRGTSAAIFLATALVGVAVAGLALGHPQAVDFWFYARSFLPNGSGASNRTQTRASAEIGKTVEISGPVEVRVGTVTRSSWADGAESISVDLDLANRLPEPFGLPAAALQRTVRIRTHSGTMVAAHPLRNLPRMLPGSTLRLQLHFDLATQDFPLEFVFEDGQVVAPDLKLRP